MKAKEMMSLLKEQWWVSRESGRPNMTASFYMLRARTPEFDVHLEVVELDGYEKDFIPAMSKADIRVIQRERLADCMRRGKPCVLVLAIGDDLWFITPSRTSIETIHRVDLGTFPKKKRYWINDSRLARWVQKYEVRVNQTPYIVRCIRAYLEHFEG